MSDLTSQQKRAVESVDYHVLVAAGAGSGKTFVLVERYLEVLRRNAEASLANVVAVTYTKKAAEEMRTRLRARLKQLAHHLAEGPMLELSPAGRDAQQLKLALKFDANGGTQAGNRWERLVNEVDTARIGTIHSLCESILKSFPVEAGVDPQFAVLDDLERAELQESAILEAFKLALSTEGRERQLFLAYPVEAIKAWISAALQAPTLYEHSRGLLPSFDQAALKANFERLLERVQREIIQDLLADRRFALAVAYLEERIWPESGSKLEAIRRDLLSLARALCDQSLSLPDRFACAKQLAGIKAGTAGGNSEEAKEMRLQMKLIRELAGFRVAKIPDDLNESDQLALTCLGSICRLADLASSCYKKAKQANGKLDFDDLICRAHDLLSSAKSSARRYYNDLFAAILVDEFQDTNALQARLIARLSGETTRVFLIGDDKQSIYKFQGADVGTFRSWRSLLSGDRVCTSDWLGSGVPGQVLNLDVSFRSHPALVNFVNAVFSRILPADSTESDYLAHFSPLSAARSEDAADARVSVINYDGVDDSGHAAAEVASLVEGKAVADWICQLIAAGQPVAEKGGGTRPIAFGDFAVLCQRNRDLTPIAACLAANKIPYVVLGGSGYLMRQEVFDIENILRFLRSPQDSHALFGALRSPMFGLPDDLLLDLVAGKMGSLWDSLQALARSAKERVALAARAHRILLDLKEKAQCLPLSGLVAEIVRKTEYDLTLLAQSEGHQRSRNLFKLVHLAKSYNHAGLTGFLAALDRMRALNVKQTEAPLDARDAVKLMTIHGAKGLEFAAVALPCLGAAISASDSKFYFHSEYGVAFDTSRGRDDEKPALYQLAKHIEEEMELAERKRLLYVAVTRARDYLAFFVNRSGRKEKSFKLWLETALDPSLWTGPSGTTYSIDGRTGTAYYAVFDYPGSSLLAGADLPSPMKDIQGAGFRGEAATTGDSVQTALLEPVYAELVEPDRRLIPQERLQRVTPGKRAPDAKMVGKLFHKLMEFTARSGRCPDRSVVCDVASSPAIGCVHPLLQDKLVAEVEQLLETFLKSPLCELIQGARRVLSETPYFILSAGLKERRPDMLLFDGDGAWHIIDFKTDHFDPRDLSLHAREHEEQLLEYVADIELLTGVSAKSWLYFSRHGILHPVLKAK